jgi:hypothetical protein
MPEPRGEQAAWFEEQEAATKTPTGGVCRGPLLCWQNESNAMNLIRQHWATFRVCSDHAVTSRVGLVMGHPRSGTTHTARD